jgi:nicotinate-nucleotide adenylyltransferase
MNPKIPESAKRIGIFGGTFDPVHEGHLHLAALARNALGLDEVHFLPCRISPHKTGLAVTAGEDRSAMLRLATRGIPWAKIDDGELRRQGPSYSYRTAEEFASRYPEARLFWIMGGDQWESLPDWKCPEKLARCVEFAVLARGEKPRPREGYRLHVIEGEHPAAATAIRQAAAAGSPLPAWISPEVAAWIAERGLYRDP